MIAVVYVCWAAFVAVWLGGYLYNLARAPRSVRSRGGGLGLGGWVMMRALVALAVVLLVSGRVSGANPLVLRALDDPTVTAIGAVILVASTVFALWARLSLGTMWSSTPMIKTGHELRTDGPYAITRHPIYTGMLGMFLGTTILTGSVLVLAGFVSFSVYVAVKIRTEEQLLTETFGDEYRRFQQSVPTVVPFWFRRSS